MVLSYFSWLGGFQIVGKRPTYQAEAGRSSVRHDVCTAWNESPVLLVTPNAALERRSNCVIMMIRLELAETRVQSPHPLSTTRPLPLFVSVIALPPLSLQHVAASSHLAQRSSC